MTNGGGDEKDGRAMDQDRMAKRVMKEKSTNGTLARKCKTLMTMSACAATVRTRYYYNRVYDVLSLLNV